MQVGRASRAGTRTANLSPNMYSGAALNASAPFFRPTPMCVWEAVLDWSDCFVAP